MAKGSDRILERLLELQEMPPEEFEKLLKNLEQEEIDEERARHDRMMAMERTEAKDK
jgi:hypothetical protein